MALRLLKSSLPLKRSLHKWTPSKQAITSRRSARSNHTATISYNQDICLARICVWRTNDIQRDVQCQKSLVWRLPLTLLKHVAEGYHSSGAAIKRSIGMTILARSTVLIRVLYSLRDTQRVNFGPSVLEKQLALFPHKGARSHMAPNLNRPAAHKERIRTSLLSIMKTFASNAFPAKSYLSMKSKYQGICSHKEIRVAQSFESRMRSSSSAQREHQIDLQCIKRYVESNSEDL